ncbi:MAG TPA: hypothetical protein VGN95_23965 [Pyrinomonadaceae bacterium]|jgi:hypothetical protein|nr:hypothetical protein [Pyrinomonadaceae bacterium]
MSEKENGGKITAGERMVGRVFQWAPWLAFFLVALPVPIYFLAKYFSSSQDAALNILLALTSLAVGSIIGFVVTLFLLYYRRHWAQKVRDRVAADGVTADEIPWFMTELTPAERQSLKEIEARNPLLADAYRETLASRITATRIIANAKRELLLVERRLNRAGYIQGADTTSLQEELRTDRQRLEQIRTEGSERRAEAEARLQMIEAASSRGAGWAETNIALQRLSANREQIPLALEAARLEQQMLEESDKVMRENEKQISSKED